MSQKQAAIAFGSRIAVMIVLVSTLAGCVRHASNLVQGYVEGEYVYVAAPLAGKVLELSVKKGDTVHAGTPLFQLDPEPEASALEEAKAQAARAEAQVEDLRKGQRPEEVSAAEARLAQARAALTFARSRYERTTKLAETRVVAPEERDQAQSDLDQAGKRVAQLESELELAHLGARGDQVTAAEAEFRRAQASLDRARWSAAQKAQSATNDALVFDTLLRPGEFAAAGQTVVTLLPPSNIKVRAYVPEPMLGSLQLGQKVEFAVDGAPNRIAGEIRYISPKAEYTPPVIYSRENRGKLVFLVEIGCAPETAAGLHPGQPVDIWFDPR